jgi:hypothetical protein
MLILVKKRVWDEERVSTWCLGRPLLVFIPDFKRLRGLPYRIRLHILLSRLPILNDVLSHLLLILHVENAEARQCPIRHCHHMRWQHTGYRFPLLTSSFIASDYGIEILKIDIIENDTPQTISPPKVVCIP